MHRVAVVERCARLSQKGFTLPTPRPQLRRLVGTAVIMYALGGGVGWAANRSSGAKASAGATNRSTETVKQAVMPPVDLSADRAEIDNSSNRTTAEGHVVIQQSSMTMYSDRVIFYRDRGEIEAEGNVTLLQPGVIFKGTSGRYSTRTQQGRLLQGQGQISSWFIHAPEWFRINERQYRAPHCRLSTCEHPSPHYHLRARTIMVEPGRRFIARDAVVFVGPLPVLYLPFVYRSLVPRPYTIEIRPGMSEREGANLRTVITYPLGRHVYSKLYIDYFSLQGIGTGAEVNYQKPNLIKGSIYGYDIKQRAQNIGTEHLPQRHVWNVRLFHWQRLSPLYSLQGTANLLNEETFSGQFLRDDFFRVARELNSSVALVRQTKRTTARLVTDRLDQFDVVRKSFFPASHTVPRVEFVLAPWRIRGSPFYVSSNLSLRRQYTRPFELRQLTFTGPGFLRHEGDFTPTLRQEVRASRRFTLVPEIGGIGSIADQISVQDSRSLYQVRYFARLNTRYRAFRWLDIDIGHSYQRRLQPNTLKLDNEVNDRGVENQISSLGMEARSGAIWRIRTNSGYDFRKNRDQPRPRFREKIQGWTSEITYTPRPGIQLVFTENFSVFPVNRTGAQQWAASTRLPKEFALTANLAYTNQQEGLLDFRYSLISWVLNTWRINLTFGHTVKDYQNFRFQNLLLKDRELKVFWDLHCWEAEALFRDRPGNREVQFRISLKADTAPKQKIEQKALETEVYPWRR